MGYEEDELGWVDMHGWTLGFNKNGDINSKWEKNGKWIWNYVSAKNYITSKEIKSQQH